MFSFNNQPIDYGDTSIPLGKRGELFAQHHYRKQGFDIVAANTFNRRGKQAGEIDLVAADYERIIFVEVKTRASDKGLHGTGAESVNIYKQRKLLKAVKIFLRRYPEYQHLTPQIDVCIVIMGQFDKYPKHVKILSNAVEDVN